MPPAQFDAVAHGKEMRARGFWVDKTFDEFLTEAVARTPEKQAIIAYRSDQPEPKRISYRELEDMVARAAGALQGMGVKKGDVVAVQLPNVWQFEVVTLAVARLGAVLNPLMPIFRERELSFMLGFAQTRVFIVPKTVRGFDHEVMASNLKKELPELAHVVVVDGSGESSFDQALLGGSARIPAAKSSAASALHPDEMSVLMFTSGTTGSPKGVMHTSNTLVACAIAQSAAYGLSAEDVLLCSAPVGHMLGFAAIMLLSVKLGATLVLQDIWEPKRGVELMGREQVTHTAGSSTFLADICDAVSSGATRPRSLRSFMCGGAPIPPSFIERAAKELDLRVCSLWGMTESLGSTITVPARALEKSATTDGCAVAGVEVQVVDEHGHAVPTGESGHLMVRGAQNFIGYYKHPELACGDEHGWFDTGDLAYMDAEGFIRISGRSKDVIIRGGENIPVFEIESLLFKHPAVADVAIVGYPDARLNERACAFIVPKPGQSIDVEEVGRYMEQSKVAKQYWPERVELATALPRTPSGKVQKFKLREQVAPGRTHE